MVVKEVMIEKLVMSFYNYVSGSLEDVLICTFSCVNIFLDYVSGSISGSGW